MTDRLRLLLVNGPNLNLLGSDLPAAEVHLSNIHRTKSLRHHSYVSAVAEMVVVGAGAKGYAAAVRHLAQWDRS